LVGLLREEDLLDAPATSLTPDLGPPSAIAARVRDDLESWGHPTRLDVTGDVDALPALPRMWLRSLGGGVFAALRGGLVAAITQDWLQVGVAV